MTYSLSIGVKGCVEGADLRLLGLTCLLYRVLLAVEVLQIDISIVIGIHQFYYGYGRQLGRILQPRERGTCGS